MCFPYQEVLYNKAPLADAIINATMDRLHVKTTNPLLKVGYDVLLEKPIANNVADLLKLKNIADQYKRKLVVCYVLSLVDCPVEKDCPYSCKKLYLDHNAFPYLVWDNLNIKDYTVIIKAEKIESLKSNNPHGKCAYKFDSDKIDQQSVIIKFDNATSANFNLVGGVAKSGRRIHIVGTKGEIEGFVKEKQFILKDKPQLVKK